LGHTEYMNRMGTS